MTGGAEIAQGSASVRIADLLLRCSADLAAAGLADARNEARWLMSAALAYSGAELVARSSETLSCRQVAAVEQFLARRARHESLSRILGRREFYGRTFEVSPATLDPRADTETLIETVVALLGHEGRERPLRILDIGTGTGCILLTLLAELPHASGIGSDLSAEALEVARRNADRLGLADRAGFVRADLAHGIDARFDVIVSNPPYIRSDDIPQLDLAVRDFDPHLALDGGRDGLEFYRRIAERLPHLLPDGIAVFETGYDQAREVADILRTAAWPTVPPSIDIFDDVAGIPRVVAARARSGG